MGLMSGRPAAAAVSDDSEKTLQDAARTASRFCGAALRYSQISTDTDFAELVLRQCSSLTPELELKWAAIEPRRGELSLTAVDDIASFARKHGKKLHGHTLLWDKSVPDWALDRLSGGDWTALQLYISSIVPRLSDVVEYWDVVNEPIDTGYRMDGLRENVFLQGFGPDYIPRALNTAREFQPAAKLLINEYGLEYDIPLEDDRRYLFLKLLERLRSKSVPLDGVGLQSHLDLRKGTVSQQKIDAFLKELAGFGLLVVITELDIHEADYIANANTRDQAVADEVRRYLDVVLGYDHVVGVSTWGLSDRYSWLEVTSEDLANYENAWKDGTGPGLNRGLPFDAALAPKKMFYEMLSCLQQK